MFRTSFIANKVILLLCLSPVVWVWDEQGRLEVPVVSEGHAALFEPCHGGRREGKEGVGTNPRQAIVR